jgi:glycosyltransferase involved in cell wall biosynthesis
MSTRNADASQADTLAYLKENLSIFVLAALTYGDTHARKHSMVEELCRQGFEAVYVEKPSSRDSIRGKTITLNDSRPWLAVPEGYVTLPSGVNVLPVPKKMSFLGVRLSLGRRHSDALINRWLKAQFQKIRGRSRKKLFCLATTPFWEPLVRGIDFDHFCYDCVDDLSVLRGSQDPERFRRMERDLVDRSEFIITPTDPLAEHMRQMAGEKEVLVLPNAVDVEYFQKKKSETFSGLAEIPGPRVGFIGQLASFIDTDLMLHAARSLPDFSFVLVGKVHSGIGAEELLAEKNVYTLGLLPFEQIPGIIQDLDVCLNPFRSGSIADVSKPVKIYEYLALGKPVISTYMPELLELGPCIHMSRTDSEFVEMIRKAVSERDESLEKLRIEYARKNTWTARIAQFLDGIVRNCGIP